MRVARKNQVLCVSVLLVHTLLVVANAIYASGTEPDALFVLLWTPIAILDLPVTAIWFVIEKILGAFNLGIISTVANLSADSPSWVTNILFIGSIYLVFGGWFWFRFCSWLTGGMKGKERMIE